MQSEAVSEASSKSSSTSRSYLGLVTLRLNSLLMGRVPNDKLSKDIFFTSCGCEWREKIAQTSGWKYYSFNHSIIYYFRLKYFYILSRKDTYNCYTRVYILFGVKEFIWLIHFKVEIHEFTLIIFIIFLKKSNLVNDFPLFRKPAKLTLKYVYPETEVV